MGSVQFGIPRELALALKAKHKIDFFVETGTLTGGTTYWACEHFNIVTTVDINQGLASFRNVNAVCSDSADFLENSEYMLPVMFWLDAHTNESCPVLREIAAINKMYPAGHVILVDDARLFGQLPAWPTPGQVIEALVDGGRRSVYIHEDVIVAEPCP